jgi:hypothetical protein
MNVEQLLKWEFASKADVLGETPLCPQQIPDELTWDQTRVVGKPVTNRLRYVTASNNIDATCKFANIVVLEVAFKSAHPVYILVPAPTHKDSLHVLHQNITSNLRLLT